MNVEIGMSGTYGGRRGTVVGLDGNIAWVKLGSGDYVNTVNFIPDNSFFEKGKTYRSVLVPVCTFDCHYTGNLGASKDRKFYAVGQMMRNGIPVDVEIVHPDDFKYWTECD